MVAGCGLFADDDEPGGMPNKTKSGTPPTPSTTPSAYATPDPDDVDFADATAVCEAFSDALFSGNPSQERQVAPIERAADYTSPAYKRTFIAQAPRLGDWEEWSSAEVTRLRHTRIEGGHDEPGEDTKTVRYRSVKTRLVPSDDEGNPLGRTYGFDVSCKLVPDADRWLVDDHSQGPIDPS